MWGIQLPLYSPLTHPFTLTPHPLPTHSPIHPHPSPSPFSFLPSTLHIFSLLHLPPASPQDGHKNCTLISMKYKKNVARWCENRLHYHIGRKNVWRGGATLRWQGLQRPTDCVQVVQEWEQNWALDQHWLFNRKTSALIGQNEDIGFWLVRRRTLGSGWSEGGHWVLIGQKEDIGFWLVRRRTLGSGWSEAGQRFWLVRRLS